MSAETNRYMNSTRIRKTLYVAFFVSIAAQIHVDFLTEGFIVAMSSVVMAIFVYCYEDLPAAYIICLSGVFSPLVRLFIDVATGDALPHGMLTVLPDVGFFFTYAAVYAAIYRFVIHGPKTIHTFPYAIFFSDMLGNTVEMLIRSLLAGSVLLSPVVIAYLAMIALLRTAIIMMVIIAIEAYGNLLINQERDREYRRLLTQGSVIEAELQLMNKNVADVEAVMKEAYDLYYRIKDAGYPQALTNDVLELAKNTHEIKGDYQNVLGVLNELFPRDLEEERMQMGEIISLERSNVLAMAKANGYRVEINTRIRRDIATRRTFKMMSIIRNLLTNAAEAIAAGPGTITITLEADTGDPPDPFGKAASYLLTVEDTGSGIAPEELDNLFLAGYSTKFDPRTGNIQRGMGLCLVKEYVEQVFHGEITIDSRPGEGTAFRIRIPATEM